MFFRPRTQKCRRRGTAKYSRLNCSNVHNKLRLVLCCDPVACWARAANISYRRAWRSHWRRRRERKSQLVRSLCVSHVASTANLNVLIHPWILFYEWTRETALSHPIGWRVQPALQCLSTKHRNEMRVNIFVLFVHSSGIEKSERRKKGARKTFLEIWKIYNIFWRLTRNSSSHFTSSFVSCFYDSEEWESSNLKIGKWKFDDQEPISDI